MSKKFEEIKNPAILLFGAPGAGKGTQGTVLGEIPRFYHYSSGEVFRQLDTRSELGREFLAYSQRGELVPDKLTIQLWVNHMNDLITTHQYKPDIDILVLDGIPRNVEQAKMLDRHVQVHQVFHLSCPDREELGRRMRKRALKEQRLDDTSEEVIERRIRTYEAETKPILDYYGPELCTEIDATQSPARVLYKILEQIQEMEAYQRIAGLTV